jgi:hypothetical protein
MRQFLLICYTLAPVVGISAQAPTRSNWDDRVEIAERHVVDAITTRRFTHDQFWRAVEPSINSTRLHVETVGESMQGRPLRTVTFGSGATKVLLWSQMHGDEATATMSLADILAFLADNEPSDLRDRLAKKLTVTFLPMLNPDGAEIFQRHNAAGIDINRDAKRLASPEARALKSVRDRINPDFGFNLHDQSARVQVGKGGEQAAIALLDPAADQARSYGVVRERALQIAAFLARDFANAVPGRIARYDDSFNPRAFGDLMQAWGTSTVLIESGALPNDPQKQRLRTLNAAAILGALDLIAAKDWSAEDPTQYTSLPFNSSGAYNLLLRGGTLVLPGVGSIRADIAINFEDAVAGVGARVAEVGDLELATAMDTIDLTGLFVHAAPDVMTISSGGSWLPIGSSVGFIVRQAKEEASRELFRVP